MSSEEEDSDVNNIFGTSKITHSGRIFSPEIAPPKAVVGPVVVLKITSVPMIIPASVPTVVPQNFPSPFINISHHKTLGIQDQARVCSAQDTSLHC